MVAVGQVGGLVEVLRAVGGGVRVVMRKFAGSSTSGSLMRSVAFRLRRSRRRHRGLRAGPDREGRGRFDVRRWGRRHHLDVVLLDAGISTAQLDRDFAVRDRFVVAVLHCRIDHVVTAQNRPYTSAT